MTRRNWIEILKSVVLLLVCLLIAFLIYFRFIASYPLNEERLNYEACKSYVSENSKELIEPLNSFMYRDNKHFSCAINDIYEKVIVIDESGSLIKEGNYRTLLNTAKTLGTKTLGMYKNSIVFVMKDIEDELRITYFDAFTGEKVFTLNEREVE